MVHGTGVQYQANHTIFKPGTVSSPRENHYQVCVRHRSGLTDRSPGWGRRKKSSGRMEWKNVP
jgi:hypothetical protein